MPITSTLSPLLLASDLLFLDADNTFAMADPQKLLNPNRTAMLVDEIRFNKFIPDPHLGQLFGIIDFLTLYADIKLGAVPLTNGYVPIRGFCPGYLASFFESTATWHFPKPLYVPPDVQFNVSVKRHLFRNFGDLEIPSWPLIISLAGRSIPAGQPVPRTIYVPWACGFNAFGDTFETTDTDIVNPFDSPMRTVYFTSANISSQGEEIAPLLQPILVSATLSNGKEFIGDQVPLNVLFPNERPILRSRALLQPKEFIRFQLEVQKPNLYADEGEGDMNSTIIGMTGYRELQTPIGALP